MNDRLWVLRLAFAAAAYVYLGSALCADAQALLSSSLAPDMCQLAPQLRLPCFLALDVI